MPIAHNVAALVSLINLIHTVHMSNLQLVHSIQRLACSKCGAEANASCNCGVPYEVVLEKREATRKRNIEYRARKANENNEDVTRHAPVENIEEFQIPQSAEKASFVMRAELAAEYAAFDGEPDDEIRTAARQTAKVWSDLVGRLGG